MTFSKSFPKTTDKSVYPKWEEVFLTEAEEKEQEELCRKENIKLMKECIDDTKKIFKEKKLKGKWRWNMADHTVILNTPATDSEQYLKRLIMQFRGDDGYSGSIMEVVS